jgi:hypothetical protein
MRRLTTIAVAAMSLGLISSGTAVAAPSSGAVPVSSSAIQVWFRHSWHATQDSCIQNGKDLAATTSYKGYACGYLPAEGPACCPWELRLND